MKPATAFPTRQKAALSLSVRVSGLLVLAAIVPLLLAVTAFWFLARPTLISQTTREMIADAQTHTELIDNFFSERLLGAEAVSRLVAVQNYLAAIKDRGWASEDERKSALTALASGHGRGSLYENWSLLDLQGKPLLWYPVRPFQHGQYYILPADLAQLQPVAGSARQQLGLPPASAKKAVISGVFYNSTTHEAYVDIYTPVTTAAYEQVGILRTTFDLRYIWDIVNKEKDTNGSGSYAFILDQNGVFVAHTSPDPKPFSDVLSENLFKAVAPLSIDTQNSMGYGDLYGANNALLPTIPSKDLADSLSGVQKSDTLTFVPPGQSDSYYAVSRPTYTVPWHYFVLSPTGTVETVPNQLLFITILVALAVAVLAILLGLGLGKRITTPILSSVKQLRKNSESLQILAEQEQNAATQQSWVVDSAQVGLQSVQYYTEAAAKAVQHAEKVSLDLLEHWYESDRQQATDALTTLVSDMQYIKKAIHFQQTSNKKLSSTIKVNVQVADQLAAGVNAATTAAGELTTVVEQLQQVVGQ